VEGTKEQQVKLSKEFIIDLDDIYQYGVETFGLNQAELYEKEIWKLVDNLTYNYLLFPECRYLQTKSKIYRWIILDSHFIIYRLTNSEVQVLRIIHAKRSVSAIKSARGIKTK
jgi:toxin ParE1/3/4